ncbi:MAG: nucleotidyltransferase [Zetaproteobacteria bacterium]|nr:MAG: nucleotidyltransferase [Zetaproteobacteria bacterium]
MKAVIQAGGKGTRLRPYTLVLPKPLMPVGDRPVIELLLKWLRRNGVEEAFVTTGYLGHLIRAVCGDGSQWDMRIHYSEEPEPLGTVGALRLVEDALTETFLMLNGDLITDLDLRAFREAHQQSGALVSVAVARKDVRVDLGVIEADDGFLIGFKEKPVMAFLVSMGVYCMEPQVIDLIPRGVPFGFDDLMHAMLDRKLPVHVYEHHGIWMDIGRPEDYQKAQRLVSEHESLFGGDMA